MVLAAMLTGPAFAQPMNRDYCDALFDTIDAADAAIREHVDLLQVLERAALPSRYKEIVRRSRDELVQAWDRQTQDFSGACRWRSPGENWPSVD